jgi:hypothetical protein
MKAIVFIFVPIAQIEDFSERFSDCLDTLPDLAALMKPVETRRKNTGSYAFWTWFLPNPLRQPRQLR